MQISGGQFYPYSNLKFQFFVWFVQERNVKQIVMHEDYDSSRISSDICLLKLSSPLNLGA